MPIWVFWKVPDSQNFFIGIEVGPFNYSRREQTIFKIVVRFNIKRGILFCVICVLSIGINWMRYLGEWFFIILKRKQFLVSLSLLYRFKASFLMKFFSRITSYSTCYCKSSIILNQFEPLWKELLNVWSYKMSQ